MRERQSGERESRNICVEFLSLDKCWLVFRFWTDIQKAFFSSKKAVCVCDGYHVIKNELQTLVG